jgi:hypothetical protein
MTNKTMTAMRITPENLRTALTAVPAVGEMHVNEVLGGYLVLNVPLTNKDGSLSKRPPKKFVLVSPTVFAEDFQWMSKKAPRAFAQVMFR